MLRAIIATVFAVLPAMASAAQEIPYRYPVQEGFILAIDDASRRAVPQDDPIARAVLDRLAEVLESDIYRVPVEYGRTLAWNNGELLVGGMGRADHLALYNRSRDRDVSRIEPASVLFLRLNRQGDNLNARMDWVDVVRGEILARYASDPVQAADAEAVAELLTPFFRDTAEDIIDRLGPAPPRGYGAVPPPWLIAPIYYQIDLRDLPEEIRAETVDFLTVELPYYLGSSIVLAEADRMVLSYETKAPSWWIAEHLDTLFAELGFAARIEPREAGLRISPAE
ncbi:MAG: hypothetical protein JJ878_17470 [Alphaproteobacteria bacterium]|nr:hypothetical protein [Alphaproteobacteria bacterium]MBO6864429.1 hypothetical protein [Alphaproteobacteria bacterium]